MITDSENVLYIFLKPEKKELRIFPHKEKIIVWGDRYVYPDVSVACILKHHMVPCKYVQFLLLISVKYKFI